MAVATLARWVGSSGTVIDTSRTSGPDFRIEYNDGRVGVGEVSWHVDPTIQEMWASTFRRPEHQQISLRPGSGQWGLKLVIGARIDRLYSNLQGFIDLLIAGGITRLDIFPSWPMDDLSNAGRRLGLEYIAQARTDDPAGAIFFLPSSPGGFIPDDPNVIVDWIEGVLDDPNYHDVTQKLLKVGSEERHVFILSGSRTEAGVDERLRRIGQSLPSRPPIVPSGITHLWVAPQFGPPVTAMWTLDSNWTVQPLVADR